MFNKLRYVLFVGIAIICAAGVLRAEDEEKPWERSIALGLSLTSGNSDSVLFTGGINGNKVWSTDELRLRLDGAYGKSDGTVNNSKLAGLVQYKHLFTERWYVTGVADGLHDDVADLSYRLTAGPGVGYYFIKSKLTRLSGEIGPACVIERFYGQGNHVYPTARLAERLDRQLTESSKIWQSLEVLPDLTDIDKYVATAEAGVEAAMTKTLSLRLVCQDRYNSQPSDDRKRNDIQLVSALAYKF